jgi:phosphoglycerol transferase MdoB-like AlkP superfamily enzyme
MKIQGIARGIADRDVFVLAAWFGLLSGLVEGVLSYSFQELEWSSWQMTLLAVSVEIVWIAALFNLLVFSFVAFGLIIARRLFRRLPWLHIVIFLFSLMTFFDWLALSGRIWRSSVLVLSAGLASLIVRSASRRSPEITLGRFRRSLPWVVAATLLALAGIQGGTWWIERRSVAELPKAPAGSRNVMIVVADTQRADHLSTYGYSRPTSPQLDRLASEGVLFEEAYSTSSWTPPSHVSILTGRYPFQNGPEDEPYDGRFLTLAEALRSRGYRTGAFSGNSYYFCRRAGFGRGFIRFEDYFHSWGDMAARTLYG